MSGQHNTTIYTEQGGDKQIVESGGEVEIQSGGTLDLQSGCTVDASGTVTVSSTGSIVVESGGQINVESGGNIGRICGVTFTIGAEAANVINVGLQLTDAAGNDLDEIGTVFAFLSDASTGIGISGTAPATSVAIGTDGAIIKEHTTKLAWTLQSEADGDIDLDITETGADTWYMVVVLPDGTSVVSGAITFAA